MSIVAEDRHVELRRDPGVSDLTLTQVLFIVGLPRVGVAAKQGPAHVLDETTNSGFPVGEVMGLGSTRWLGTAGWHSPD